MTSITASRTKAISSEVEGDNSSSWTSPWWRRRSDGERRPSEDAARTASDAAVAISLKDLSVDGQTHKSRARRKHRRATQQGSESKSAQRATTNSGTRRRHRSFSSLLAEGKEPQRTQSAPAGDGKRKVRRHRSRAARSERPPPLDHLIADDPRRGPMAPPNYMLALREDHTPRTMSLASTRALVTHSRHMTQRVRERQAMKAARAKGLRSEEEIGEWKAKLAAKSEKHLMWRETLRKDIAQKVPHLSAHQVTLLQALWVCDPEERKRQLRGADRLGSKASFDMWAGNG